MAKRLPILLIAALLFLLSAPSIARPDDGEGKAKEAWEKQREQERKERQKKLMEALKGKSPQEREEILKKLKELERKAMRDRLRERYRLYKEFKDRLLRTLDEPTRDRFDKLSPDKQRALLFHCMRRVWTVGRERFEKSLTDDERKSLEGLSRRDRRKLFFEITDRRVRDGLTLAAREELEALPEAERKKRFAKHRMDYIRGRMVAIEREVVFPETAELLRKPEKDLEKILGRGKSDRRPHHRRGHRFPDKELHDLLHKIPEEHRKAADEEFLRIVSKVGDEKARKKELEEFKARLRKLLKD
ncbi:MAG: hypothetical protein ABFS86_06905 [Planctomycetota bacterium]